MQRQLLLLVGFFLAAGAVKADVSPPCAGTDDSAVFSAAIAQAESGGTIQPAKGVQCALNSMTIPASVNVDFTRGGTLKANPGQTVTYLAGIMALPTQHIFQGPGSFSFAGNTSVRDLEAGWFGVLPDGGVTDRAGEMDRAVKAALTRDIATLNLPPGTVLINGSPSGPPGHQTRVRTVNTNGEVGLQMLVIRGAGPAPQFSQTVNVIAVYPTQGTIIKSTATGGGSLFGGSNGSDFTRLTMVYENFRIILPDNPQVGGIDGWFQYGQITRGISIDTGRNSWQVTQPTGSTTGIVTPATWNGAHTIMENCYVQGTNIGFDIGEHVVGEGNNYASATNIAFQFEASDHGNYFDRLLVQNSARVLKFVGVTEVYIAQLDIEHDGSPNTGPAWETTIWDLDDPNNVGLGSITHARRLNTFRQNGGANLAVWKLSDLRNPLTGGKSPATITLSNLSQSYDGTPKPATATTNPAGLSGVAITYDGSSSAPTNAGSYSVVASLTNNTYAASNATGTLVIAKANPTISWSNPANIIYGTALSSNQLNAIASFGGTPLSGSFAYTPPSGTVLNVGNNQLLSTAFTPTDSANFNSATSSVRINVVTSARTNVALAANGGVATASSYWGVYLPGKVIDGDRTGVNDGVWLDGTYRTFPDWVQIDFNGSKTIDEIDFITRQDDVINPVQPTLTQTFGVYGVTTFDVQYWNGSSWVTVPNGSVTGNDKVWRQFTFSAITTTKIRVVISDAVDHVFSRVVEIEAWGQ